MASATEEIDLYATLNISKSASKAEIKKAYHKAALSSHPDKVPDDQREVFEGEAGVWVAWAAYECRDGDSGQRGVYEEVGD